MGSVPEPQAPPTPVAVAPVAAAPSPRVQELEDELAAVRAQLAEAQSTLELVRPIRQLMCRHVSWLLSLGVR